MSGQLIARFEAVPGGFAIKLHYGHGFSRAKNKIRPLRNLPSVQELVKLKTGDGWRIALCESYDMSRADAVLSVAIGLLANEQFQIVYANAILPVTKQVLLEQIMKA